MKVYIVWGINPKNNMQKTLMTVCRTKNTALAYRNKVAELSQITPEEYRSAYSIQTVEVRK